MIAAQTFKNFQDMYERAVKIARVLEEIETENWAANFGKRKLDLNRGRFRGMNPKPLRPGKPQEKGKQPMAWQNKPFCRFCSKHHNWHVPLRPYDTMDLVKWDIR